MDIKDLKTFLSNHHDKVREVLEELGCHHITYHDGVGVDCYYTCGNFDGDNPSAITVYLSPSLLTLNYTRDMCHDKNACDLLDLVSFVKSDKNFFQNLKWVSDVAGIGYYHNFDRDLPESLKILKMLDEFLNKEKERSEEQDNTPITPRPEQILDYYFPYVSEMFAEDGIDYGTQRTFEIGFDPFSSRWVLPIRDELGIFIGSKGRYFYREVPEGQLKYVYLEPCPKGKVLYGYWLSKDHISQSDTVIVGESEKSAMQYWSAGIKNVVSTGGTKISSQQVDMLSRLGKKILLSFDKDFDEEKIQGLRNKFLGQIEFSAIIDRDGLLGEKESPSDNPKKLEKLLKNNVYKIEKGE
jgi:DNA primase